MCLNLSLGWEVLRLIPTNNSWFAACNNSVCDFNTTVLSDISAMRVFGSSKIPKKELETRKMLDLVANARRPLDIV